MMRSLLFGEMRTMSTSKILAPLISRKLLTAENIKNRKDN